MRDDADIARVAAALNAPGLRYRSFNNAPVRVHPGIRGDVTMAAPAAPEPVLAESAIFAPIAHEPPSREESPPFDRNFEYAAEAPAQPDTPPVPEPLVEAVPEPQPEPEPEPPSAAPPPLFSWPEVTPAAPLLAEPAPGFALQAPRSSPAQIAPAPPDAAPVPVPVPAPAPVPVSVQPIQSSPPDYRLFNALGRQAEPPAAPVQPQASNTTLGMLRRRIDAAPDMPLPFQGLATPPPAAPSVSATILAANAVTVPLSDVMRLINAGSAPATSPFEAFRSALSAQPPR